MLGAELRFSAKSNMCFWWLAEIFPFEKGSHIFQTDLKLTLQGEGEGHLVWKLWDYRHAPPCWLYVVQRNELKALWMDFTELYPQPFILFLSHQCIIDKIYHSFSSELTHTTGFKKKLLLFSVFHFSSDSVYYSLVFILSLTPVPVHVCEWIVLCPKRQENGISSLESLRSSQCVYFMIEQQIILTAEPSLWLRCCLCILFFIFISFLC